MVILYHVIHKNHPKEIELCGRFDDMEHFKRFQKVEKFRGWTVQRMTILKEEEK